MCGITGFFNLSNLKIEDPISILHKMNSALRHRGPDDSGVWFNQESGVFLGHRRLSILDLSEAGSQPMVSSSGRYVMVFNGEIYNHLNLRKKLQSKNWVGHSDTETILSVLELYGIEETLKKLKGMFALALWDKKLQRLTLARDRIGEKPLYYFYNENFLIFGSELKAITLHPLFKKSISRSSISLMMQYCYIPSPKSIYKKTYKLEAGSYKHFDKGESIPQSKFYWDARNLVVKNLNSFSGDLEEATNQLEVLLTKAIKSQMLSDVPIGAFLSGGIDSSLIVSIMQSISKKQIKTFSIGFHEKIYNEADKAKEISDYLGTSHTELYLSQSDTINIIPEISSIYCEPFSDCSQIPTYILSKMTKENVTVSLSGDGGDELFGGYNRYTLAPAIWDYIRWLNPSLRDFISKLICTPSPDIYNKILGPLQKILPNRLAQTNIGDKIHKASIVLNAASKNDLYQKIARIWQLESLFLNDSTQNSLGGPALEKQITDSFIHDMMAIDMLNYLPDDILVKVDRAAMAVSLETRVPFLDKDVLEFAWSLPINYKVKSGNRKIILENLLSNYLPKKLYKRPKMGFGLPISYWLREELRDWAESLLDKKKLEEEGYFSSKKIREKWEEHLSGSRNWQYQLWNVLMFQQWLDNQ